jgi:hypothetical protein
MPIEITAIRWRTQIDQTGNVYRVRRVDFVTETGQRSFVEVPENATQADIRKAVEQEAKFLDSLIRRP